MRGTVSIEDIVRFKAEAKQMVLANRVKHSAALSSIARREGFRDWPELLAEVGTSQEVTASIRSLGLRGPSLPNHSESEQ